jgi:hypothetical protein
MRHVTRRRHRIRRARLSRRRRQQQQQQQQQQPSHSQKGGGDALLGTESLTKWLHKVFNRYSSFGQTTDGDRVFVKEQRDRGVTFGAISEGDAVKFDHPETEYILPLEISPEVKMPTNKKEIYDLKGNYGRIIRLNVMTLSSAQSGNSVSQMNSLRFSSSVDGMMSEAETSLYPIEEVLKTENILRGILRAGLNAEDISRYKHIAEDVTSLSDANTYPLYVWAVSLNFDTEDAAQTQLLIPMLVPEDKIETSMMQTGPVPPAGLGF